MSGNHNHYSINFEFKDIDLCMSKGRVSKKLTEKILNGKNEKIKKLEAENKMMRECLEFYAKTNVWGINLPNESTSIDPCDHEDFFHQEIGITTRGGKKAREVLSKLDLK